MEPSSDSGGDRWPSIALRPPPTWTPTTPETADGSPRDEDLRATMSLQPQHDWRPEELQAQREVLGQLLASEEDHHQAEREAIARRHARLQKQLEAAQAGQAKLTHFQLIKLRNFAAVVIQRRVRCLLATRALPKQQLNVALSRRALFLKQQKERAEQAKAKLSTDRHARSIQRNLKMSKTAAQVRLTSTCSLTTHFLIQV